MTQIIPPSPEQVGATERLFVALALPEAVRRALAALAQPLPGVRWTRPEQLHLTLRFLGDVPVKSIDGVICDWLDLVDTPPSYSSSSREPTALSPTGRRWA